MGLISSPLISGGEDVTQIPGQDAPPKAVQIGGVDSAGDTRALLTKVDGTVLVEGPVGLTDTQLRAAAVPVSVTALPLPADAATQTTLSAINVKTLAAGQAVMAASSPVVLASDQPALAVSGTVTANIGTAGTLATAAKQPALGVAGTPSTDVITIQGHASGTPLPVSLAGAATEVTLTTRVSSTEFQARLNTLGAKTSANSAPVVLASDQVLPLPAGASTSAKQPALGVAGTAATDVLTVQGIASMTALKTDGSAVTQPVTFSTSGTLNNGAQTTVGSSAVQVLAASASTKTAIIQNNGSAFARIGVSGVTATTGYRLAPGESVTFDVQTAIYAIREAGVDTTIFTQAIT